MARKATVVKDNGTWVVKTQGREVSVQRSTQAEAIDDAREWLLHNGGGELVVLGDDGQVQQKDTLPRPDPRASAG